MDIEKFDFPNLFLLKPKIWKDERGYFFESFNSQKFSELTNINVNFVQDNQSFSKYGTIRGLHLQTGDYAQAKLVRVTLGKVIDVVVDLRKESPTYLKHKTFLLDSTNHHQLYIPRGFAHGFAAISDEVVFQYKCDNYYNQKSETGIRFDDPDLNINWEIKANEYSVSEKDLKLPNLKQYIKGQNYV